MTHLVYSSQNDVCLKKSEDGDCLSNINLDQLQTMIRICSGHIPLENLEGETPSLDGIRLQNTSDNRMEISFSSSNSNFNFEKAK